MENKKTEYKYSKTNEGIKYKYVLNGEYAVIPIETSYIKPNESLDKIFNVAMPLFEDEDYLVIAETPISVSQGRLVDEAQYSPSLSSKFLARVWSKYIWGYILGPLLKIKKRTIKNLRILPPQTAAHKQVVLELYGWKHALKPASEAGIDLSNSPGTFVSLLPENPQKVAENLSNMIKNKSNKDVNVMIIDTDATYKRGDKYFTGLPTAIEGIQSNKGVWGYTLGQISENMGSTPLGSSKKLSVEYSLKIANIAEDYQKSLETSMETIHSAKKVLSTDSDEDSISVETLNKITHTPAVIIRKNKKNTNS